MAHAEDLAVAQAKLTKFSMDGLDTTGADGELDKTLEYEADAAIEEEDKPISKKDNAIKTLVNFDDLKKGKTTEEEKKEAEAKPIYIDAEASRKGPTGFVPAAVVPTPDVAPVKAITFDGVAGSAPANPTAPASDFNFGAQPAATNPSANANAGGSSAAAGGFSFDF